ncbi:MAG: hypothetical protein K8R63_04890 [Bacteroidales bacterium]|nr:hypothetical protein [Bacteroidales bacterium]
MKTKVLLFILLSGLVISGCQSSINEDKSSNTENSVEGIKSKHYGNIKA